MSEERTEHEEYALGEEVTEHATPKSHSGTVVVSIRLPVAEFAQLETSADAAGKTISQLVREAVRAYLLAGRYQQQGPRTVISTAMQTSSTGALSQWSEPAARSERVA